MELTEQTLTHSPDPRPTSRSSDTTSSRRSRSHTPRSTFNQLISHRARSFENMLTGEEDQAGRNGRRKRDHSWDQKWSQHLERNMVEEGGSGGVQQSIAGFRARRQPGKINPGVYWESTERSTLPPKSPSQKRKQLSLVNGFKSQSQDREVTVLRGSELKTKSESRNGLEDDDFGGDAPRASSIEDVPALLPAKPFRDDSFEDPNMSVLPPPPPELTLDAIGIPEAVSPVEIDRSAGAVSPSVKRRLVVRVEAKAESSKEQIETKNESSDDLGRDNKSDVHIASSEAAFVSRSDSEVIPVLIDPCLSQEEERKLEMQNKKHRETQEEEENVRKEERSKKSEESEFQGVFRAEPAKIDVRSSSSAAFSNASYSSFSQVVAATTVVMEKEEGKRSSAAEYNHHHRQKEESHSKIVSEETKRQVASEATAEEVLRQKQPMMAPVQTHVSSSEVRRPLPFPEKAGQKDSSSFSISGMWSNVDLGIVKERSSPWKKKKREQQQQQQQQLHKTWSSGDLADETRKSTVVKEAAGRKSADVFSGKKVVPVPMEYIVQAEEPMVQEEQMVFETPRVVPQVVPMPVQEPLITQEFRVPVEEPMVLCQSAYETTNREKKLDQNVQASEVEASIAAQLEGQMLFEDPMPSQQDQEVPSLPMEPEPEPQVMMVAQVVPQMATTPPSQRNLSASPNLFQQQGPMYDAITLTPGSSFNDLSTCCGGSECGSVGSRRPNSRRKKSSKIAEDIARRAEDFARMEEKKKKKEELRRQSAEKVEEERKKNMGQINETIKKKLPQKKDKIPVVEQGYLDKKKQPSVEADPPTSLADKQRMLEIQADLQRQREEQDRRLAQVEEDRQRQLREEEERVRREKEAELDPAAVFKQVEQKLHDQKVREERKNRRKQHQMMEENNKASSSGLVVASTRPSNVQVVAQGGKEGEAFSSRDVCVKPANNITPGMLSSTTGGAPLPPPPPARDIECETKVLQKITSSGRFPSQQERWAAKQMQQEEERRLKEQENKRRQGNNKSAVNIQQTDGNSLSIAHSGVRRSSSGGSNSSGGSDDSSGMRASFMAKQSSLEEEKKLQTWLEMQRQQDEMEELMLREMEREVERHRSKETSIIKEEEEAPPLPPPPSIGAGKGNQKEASPPLPPPPPAAELLSQASSAPPPPPPQRAKVRQLKRSDDAEAKQAQEWEEIQKKQEEQQEVMIRELEREEARKKRQRAEEERIKKEEQMELEMIQRQLAEEQEAAMREMEHTRIQTSRAEQEREEREQQMEWEMIQRQQEEEQESMQRQMEMEKALTGGWHDKVPEKKERKDDHLPLELQVIQKRQEYEMEQERRREVQRAEELQRSESQKWEEIQRQQEEDEEMTLRKLERELSQTRRTPESSRPKGVIPPQLSMTATVTPVCRKRSPPIQPLTPVEKQQADWEAIKKQQEDEEMFAVMQTERDLLRDRQMQDQLRESREDKTPRNSQERDQRDWRELQRKQEEDEERMRMREERELQRQRSTSQEKKVGSAQHQPKRPMHHKASPPRVSIVANENHQRGPNSPQIQQQEQEWQTLRMKQEEEDAALLMRLERDLLKERQLSENRESERLDAIEIMRMKEEEERMRIQHEHEVHDREVVSQRIKAMSISEEDEAAEEAVQEAAKIAKRDAEFERLAQIEERKREVEEELEREKMHLEELQKVNTAKKVKPKAVEQYEAMVRTNGQSPSPQTKRKGAPSPQFEAHEKEREQQLQKIKELKELEQQKLKELEQVRKQNITPTASGSQPTAVGAALPPRPASKHPKTRQSSEREAISVSESHMDYEEDIFGGYSEGCDDFSIGIDLPAQDQSSRDITPIPTTGELEDIRAPQLKSLLKKPSFEEQEAVANFPPPPPMAFDTEEARRAREDSRSCSPKKAVHFSEVNDVQVGKEEK